LIVPAQPSLRRRKRCLLQSAIRVVTLLVWLLAGICLPALAKPLDTGLRDAIVERNWLDDPASGLSPKAAIEANWTRFSGSLSRGFVASGSTTWLRLRIDPAAAGPGSIASDDRLLLRIMPGHLDEIALFRADRLSDPPVLVGDRHPATGPGQTWLSYVIALEAGTQPFDVLLRLRTQSNHSIDIRVMRWDDARAESVRQHYLVIAYLVFTLMVIVWAAVVWLEYRDTLLGLFIAHQGTALLLALTLLGVLRVYGPAWLDPLLLDRLTSFVIPLHAAMGTLFHSRLLADLGARKADSRLLLFATMAPVVALFLSAFGEVRVALMLTQGTIPVLMALIFVIAWRVHLDPSVAGPRGTWWRRAHLVGVYAVLAALTMPQSLRVLGVLPAGTWTYGAFIAYSVASAILLGSLLVIRGRDARRRRKKVDEALERVRREADTQRARVTEQAELITMLAHELKTPLSVVSLALGSVGSKPSMRERAIRAVGNMRSVIDRCEQVALVDDTVVRHDASMARVPVALETIVEEVICAQLHADRVDCQFSPGLPHCLADRQMVSVIVTNLLENALRYGPPGGRVRVCVMPASRGGRQGLSLQVFNQTGPAGKPDAGRLFEKYYRSPRARFGSGSGLGLYLSQRLAGRMGGELSFRDSEADEVRFELWLSC
jgi:two-component system, sensor histidine kinase LadS